MIVAHRLAIPADIPFIHDAWLESFKLSHAAGPIPMDMYRPVYRQVIEAVLRRQGVRVLVAYNSEDHDQIFGFVVHERHPDYPVIHYVFVKQFARRQPEHLGTALLKSAGVDPTKPFVYTFKTPVASKIAQKWTGARFDPLVARFPPRLS